MKNFETDTGHSSPHGLSLHAFSLGNSPNAGIHLDIQKGDIFWIELAHEAARAQWVDIFSFNSGTFNGAFSFLGKRITPNFPLQALLALKEHVQTVRPLPHFIEAWPAIANLSLPLRLRSLSRQQVKQRCHEAISWAGAQKWMNKPVYQLSDFQRLELNWLQALITNPDFLIIHAQMLPFDDILSAKINATLENMSRHGTMIMIVATSMDRMSQNFWQSRLPKIHVLHLPD